MAMEGDYEVEEMANGVEMRAALRVDGDEWRRRTGCGLSFFPPSVLFVVVW